MHIFFFYIISVVYIFIFINILQFYNFKYNNIYNIVSVDVITFPPNSVTQSISVEVMPLLSGFLPIPTLNIFHYYPSNSRQNTGKSMVLFFVIIYLNGNLLHIYFFKLL